MPDAWMPWDTYIVEHTKARCPQCGQEYITHGDDWGYAYKHRRVCSYRCMRALQRADEKEQERKAQLAEEKPLPRQKAKVVTPDGQRKILEMWAKGAKIGQIAKKTAYSTSLVISVLMEHDVYEQYRDAQKRDAAEWMILRRQGMSLREIGDRYNVDRTIVRRELADLENREKKNVSGTECIR